MPLLHTLKVVAALGTLSSAAWVSTFAAFSDSGTATGGSFTTGTLDLRLGGGDNASLTSLALANAEPGDAVYAPLVVSNPGGGTSSLALTYAMSGASTGHAGLGAALRVGVRLGVSTCTAAGFTADGSELLPATSLASAALSGRTLAAGASETLCFQLTLPSTVTDNALQGQTAGAAFAFTASS